MDNLLIEYEDNKSYSNHKYFITAKDQITGNQVDFELKIPKIHLFEKRRLIKKVQETIKNDKELLKELRPVSDYEMDNGLNNLMLSTFQAEKFDKRKKK